MWGARGRPDRFGVVALVALIALGAVFVASAPRAAVAAPQTQVLTAAADTHVDSSAASTPLGTQVVVSADASPTKYVFLRFAIPTVTGTITAATLRLHTQNSSSAASPAGGTVRKITSNTWSEASTTYNNRPSTSGTTVGSLGAVASNTWYQLNALASVVQGSSLNLAIVTTNTDGASYDAREAGANGPQLVLTIETEPSSAVTLAAVADTYVEAGTAAGTSFGTATSFVADASPIRQSFLRFDLRSLTTVATARLRLHVVNDSSGPSPAGGTVTRLTGAWDETTTYNTRPTIGSSIGAFGSVAANAWVELDVMSAVVAGAYLDLGLTSSNTDGAYYNSRESGSTAPQLIVTTTAAPPTAPPTTAPSGIVIAAVGDMACAPTSPVTSSSCRQLTVSNIIHNDPAIQHFLVLGDLQYPNGELANFQSAYESSYGRFKAKTKPAPGNHEYNTAGATGYYQYFGAQAGDPAKGYYSFDVGTTWHIVAINSNCSAVSCALGSTQEQWLRKDLSDSTRQCTIGYWHHPRHTSSSRGDNTNMDAIWRAFADDGAELVLTGHEHVYERFAPMNASSTSDASGLREIIVGTGGNSLGSFGTTRANSLVRIRAFAVLKLTLSTSSYSWQLVNESGAVLDSGTGTCH